MQYKFGKLTEKLESRAIYVWVSDIDSGQEFVSLVNVDGWKYDIIPLGMQHSSNLHKNYKSSFDITKNIDFHRTLDPDNNSRNRLHGFCRLFKKENQSIHFQRFNFDREE